MKHIREYFEKSMKLSDEDWSLFSSKLTRHKFPKNQILLQVGQTENYLSFIESGIIRFFIPKEENDVTFSFIFSNSFMSGYESFITQTPSIYSIETLAETVLWRISYEDLQIVYKESEIGNIIGRLSCENLYLRKSKREISLLRDTAEQRYQNLFREQPYILEHISLKYIASFIGVTPQALSRIRKRIS